MDRNGLGRLMILLLALIVTSSWAQQATDTVIRRDFRKLDIFPAISYSPETKLTLGVIGILYFDFSGGDFSTPLSNLEFLAVYTLNQQVIVESKWEFFMNHNRWRTRGEAFFNRYPDRNYGIGNTADALVAEVDDEGNIDTLNYLNFNSFRIKFSPVFLRKIRKNLFLGLQYDMETLYKMTAIPDEYYLLNEAALEIETLPVEGIRSGIGLQLLHDSRDFIMNPIKGNLFEVNVINYAAYLGSDFAFTSFSADLRHYANTFRNQTLAMRLMVSKQWKDDAVPMRALSRVGGHKFMRGYFKGTYQDYNLVAVETEYRLPLWQEDTTEPLWKVWRRLGIVGFASAAQVAHTANDFRMDQFRYAAGGGLRILFNPKTRVNIRIDYAIGFAPGSDGPGKHQSGFYFYLGESF